MKKISLKGFILHSEGRFTMNSTFKTIEEYIQSFPSEIQVILSEIRKAISEELPDAEEKISYQMPTFFLNGNVVHFAAFKNHIGFYPLPSGMEFFSEELSKYKTGKGSIQFPLDQPMPIELIKRIARFRANENLKK